jgi:hypothetical protein
MSNALRTQPSTFTAEDFKLWEKEGILVITPKFQRRPVWKGPNKSFFIDTLLRGMPVPPIYLRNTQNETKTKNIREVVDGQQRIRCVMEFMDDGFRLSKTLRDTPWAGERFSGLDEDQKNQIRTYGFPIQTFQGISDREVLEVFSRLNMYSVPLNKQELRNGKWFGLFKQTCYALAHEYIEFWRKQEVFSWPSIARMQEVEMVSELLIAGNAGMQDKKGSIEDFYRELDQDYPHQQRDEKRFHEVMAVISETFGTESISGTEFRRSPLFYTLYCVIFHQLFGLPNMPRSTPKKKPTKDDRELLRDAVFHLSEILSHAKDAKDDPTVKIPQKYNAFVSASSGGQSDNVKPRVARFNALAEAAAF